MGSNWPDRTIAPPLRVDEVHVWCVRLASSPELAALLSPDEQARAVRFHFKEDREYYQYGRAILRTLIGQYEQIEPTAVSFVYGEHGKPGLAEGDLRFNLSHAEGVALIAFARGREIGVDVEMVRPLSDADRVARRFFSEREYGEYTAVPGAQKPRAFFNCWTRKEAFIKAIGEGLSCPLKSFEVTLLPDERAQLREIRGSETAAAHWMLHSLDPIPGYVGAVIAEGQDWRLHCWHWL